MNRRERRVAARKSPAASKGRADSSAALYEAGLGHFQAGRHLDAQICCQRALALDAGHADTLHLMGLLSLHAKQYDAAIEWVGRANRADPKRDYLASLGAALEQQGLHQEALQAFDKAVQISPDDAELWARLANVLVLLHRPDQAIPGFERALKLNQRFWYAAYNYAVLLLQSERFEETLVNFNLCDELLPNHVTTLTGRGRALFKLNRFEEALSDGRRAQALDPANADICIDLGVALQKLGQPEEALQWFDRALDLRPGFVMALTNKGSLLLESERFEESLINFNLCDELQPDHATTLFGRSVALYKLNRFEEALSDGKRAQALDPANADICNAIGVTLHKLGRPEDALEWFDRALDLRPDFVKALNNKAFMLGEIHRFDEALMLFRHVKRIDPENAETDWNVALIQMLNGDFEAGWPGREARWKIPSLSGTASYLKFPQPMWLGEENVEGKTILICADEGLGDTIQFVRYAPMLAALGARVILLPQEPLYPLLSGLPGVSQCLPKNGSAGLPAFDFHCPILSLPLAFRTTLETIPAPASYLPTPAQDRRQIWEERLGQHDRLRVGLVWSGNPKHKNDHNRSIPLRTLSRILDVDATFVSLQKDARPVDKAFLLERTDIVDLTAHLTDFMETAALISCLDLVITVDTSIAHLAGALGRPTWILLPHTPDWRWLLDRDDSPWYPSVRLFRQTETRDYASVLDRVRSELQKLIDATPQHPGAGTPASLYQAGLGHMKAGRYRDAQACGEQALAIDSDHADSLHLMGLLSHQAKQYDHAVEWIARALRQHPKPDYLANLGTALQHLGRHEEACKAFETALRLKPDDAGLWKKLGNAQGQLARPAEAVSSLQHVLRLKPDDWDAANKCGMFLDQLARLEEALAYFNLCEELQPNDFQTLRRRAMCLYGLRRFEQALGDLERTHALDPDNIENINDIGVALQSLGRDKEALGWFEKTLARQPDLVEALNNKAISLGRLRRFEEAIATHLRVKAIDPDNTAAALSLGHLYLLMGNFEAGWAGHEARLKNRSAISTTYPQPRWFGERSIEGKTILIHVDEGLGDTIQFARYVPMLAARGARVILVVQPAVRALLSKLPGAAQCFSRGVGALPVFDVQCPISSLPLAFGTQLDTIPSGAQYLPSPPANLVQAFEDRLGPHDRLRVGLVWSGNSNHSNDHNRSIHLQALSRIVDVDATFVSLQKDPRPHDKATLCEWTGIIDLTADLTDFVATAALLSCLDLVITVDTSVAHLAGALGRPTWILLPYVPDYRWLLDRDDSPWYPTARLFRQTDTRDWHSVVENVRTALNEFGRK